VNQSRDPLAGQPLHEKFGTCAFWNEIQNRMKAQASDGNSGAIWNIYRLGLAAGFALGTLSDLDGYAVGPGTVQDPPRRILNESFESGQVKILERPVTLVEAFDVKCSDFRNAGLALWNVGFLSILDIGGIPSSRTEAALNELRKGGDDVRFRVIAVLTAAR
jgi:hypothetical protein